MGAAPGEELRVLAPEDGEMVCLGPSQLQAIKRLMEHRNARDFTLLQGRDGTLFLMLDDATTQACWRVVLLEDMA